jgi:glycosyltransferase involved in cell wall biosynthesis
MNDILLISMETWGRVWRRNQNLAVGLARRFPQQKILFVTLPVDLSNAVRCRHWNILGSLAKTALRPARPQPLPGYPNLLVFTPVKLFPHTLTLGRLMNQARTRSQIRRAMRQAGMTDPLLYINPYFGAHMIGKMGESALIYDVGEDWSHIEPKPWLRRQMIDEDLQLTRAADAVIAVSPALKELKKNDAREIHVVPNGVHVDRYTKVASRTLTPHLIAADWARPVLGHTGTLQSKRTNVDLIIRVARAFPQSTIALVGPDSLEPADSRKLRAEPNIRMTGEIDFADMPRVMSAFDVCIVPQQVNGFSESQNPLKMFEYLASGLPIVSTKISGFREYPELVHLAGDADEFITAVKAAMVEPASLAAARQRAAAPHTWESRIERIIEICQSCLDRRQGTRGKSPAGATGEVVHAC